MATQENDSMCVIVVKKMTTGASLSDAEKSHLASCEDCMADVIDKLDQSAAGAPQRLNAATGGMNGDQISGRGEAKRALERGRRVFEREFGISLSKE